MEPHEQHFVSKTDALSFLLVANSTFAITKLNLCVISSDSNNLASVKEIEKIPSPVWALCQQEQHWGKKVLSAFCDLGTCGTARGAGVPPPGELGLSSATARVELLPALCCTAAHARAVKLL